MGNNSNSDLPDKAEQRAQILRNGVIRFCNMINNGSIGNRIASIVLFENQDKF